MCHLKINFRHQDDVMEFPVSGCDNVIFTINNKYQPCHCECHYVMSADHALTLKGKPFTYKMDTYEAAVIKNQEVDIELSIMRNDN